MRDKQRRIIYDFYLSTIFFAIRWDVYGEIFPVVLISRHVMKIQR